MEIAEKVNKLALKYRSEKELAERDELKTVLRREEAIAQKLTEEEQVQTLENSLKRNLQKFKTEELRKAKQKIENLNKELGEKITHFF